MPVSLRLSACLLCAATAAAAPLVPALRIVISPASVRLAPGASTMLDAHASGGEAMRLLIEWRIEEGERGGWLEPFPERSNGEVSARYTAPAASGTYHVRVQLRGFPAVSASTAISVAPASDAAPPRGGAPRPP